ncbi:MAG: peptidylprolyl isomerase, partial [Pseudomonadota bacterium]
FLVLKQLWMNKLKKSRKEKTEIYNLLTFNIFMVNKHMIQMNTILNRINQTYLNVILLSLLCLTLLFSTSLSRAEIIELDSIVAVVNNGVITKQEMQRAFNDIVKSFQRRNAPIPAANILSKQVLDKLIMEKIQLDLAERSGIRSDDTTLNRAIVKIAAQNGLSLSEFINTITEQGLNFKEFRNDIRTQILLQRLQQRFVDSKIIITNQEIDNFLFNYKKQGDIEVNYHPAIILISLREGSTPAQIKQTKQKADFIYQQLSNGANFADLAIEHSDSNNALEGGDLGWRKQAELPSMLSETVPTMQAGDFSKPIKIPVGFIIVKLLEKESSVQHQIVESHALHILIKPDINHTATQAKIRLQQLRKRIISGEDFGTLAKAHSNDKGSAQKGGDLGWFKPGTMVPEFDKALLAMSQGEVSEIVETPFGYHIIKLLERRTRDDSDQFLRDKVREKLRNQKIEDQKLLWLRRIRDEAHIEIRKNN